jgi:hypothetical protein
VAAVAEVEVTISGLKSLDLAAFDLDVNYDEALLTFDSYTLTEELGSFALDEAEDWSLGDFEGSVNLSVVSYLDDFSAQPDAFTLATLSFSGDEAGLSGINLSEIILSDDFGDPIPYTVAGTHIEVVPIPGALWLLGSALAGLVGIRKRFRR